MTHFQHSSDYVTDELCEDVWDDADARSAAARPWQYDVMNVSLSVRREHLTQPIVTFPDNPLFAVMWLMSVLLCNGHFCGSVKTRSQTLSPANDERRFPVIADELNQVSRVVRKAAAVSFQRRHQWCKYCTSIIIHQSHWPILHFENQHVKFNLTLEITSPHFFF